MYLSPLYILGNALLGMWMEMKIPFITMHFMGLLLFSWKNKVIIFLWCYLVFVLRVDKSSYSKI